MDIKKLFGKKVKERRLALSFTQEELAEKIGISAKSLSQIELGNNFVSADNLDAICSALDVKPKNLFDFGDNENIDKLKVIDEKLQKNHSLISKIYEIILLLE